MSNDEGSPSWGSKLKKALSFFKPEGVTHKLGQNPVSLKPEVLNDPDVQKVVDHTKSTEGTGCLAYPEEPKRTA
ncbi:MAG: hypothetical protein RLN62_02995 [Rickettsiales bacterium]